MNLLIVPDIFGPSPALAQLARDLASAAGTPGSKNTAPGFLAPLSIEILDTYGNGTWFRDEAEAYACFTDRIGVPAYAQNLRRHLEKAPAPRILVGFSAGASAVWHLAGTAPCPDVTWAVCFYGSQIRHETFLTPGFPILNIFPEAEPHFEVDELMADLAGTPRTFCYNAPGRHGFMNLFSDNFDQVLYDRYLGLKRLFFHPPCP